MKRETYIDLQAKHYEPNLVENQIYAFWEANSVFEAGKDRSKPPFSIVIPPPNVTGRLHMGHALNNTIQDVLIRYKRMDGFDAVWIPGTDHAGISTQSVLKKQLDAQGINFKDLGREVFIERVWQWKEKYGDHILMQLKRMGCSCDWSRTAFTMSPELSAAVNVAFKKMYDAHLIYRGKYIVNWCPVDRTALSDDEVKTKEGGEPGHLWYFRYPFKEGSGFVTIATTRPETMFGDVAVAVNPKDERYQKLIGKTLILPLLEREIPIIADDYVDAEFGTGCVKITPAHDPNDFQIGLRHSLPQINVMNEDASMNDIVPAEFRGLNRFVARKKVVAAMQQLKLVEKIEDRMTPVGRAERSGEVIEYRLSDQWFVKVRPLAEQALERSKSSDLKFYPERWHSFYCNWLEKVYDWCISRQIWWGHQIPAWYNKTSGEILVDTKTPQQVLDNPDDWRQDEDVLDTWFSSALWPYSTFGWPEKTEDLERYYPTNVLITAKDIISLWVARMVMTGLFNVDQMPFKEVLINPVICDEDGETMSKSKGNGVDPLHVIDGATTEELTGPIYEARPSNMKELLARVEKLFPHGFTGVGADAMRYTLLHSATDAQQTNISLKKFAEIGRPLGDKLWNAAKLTIDLIQNCSATEQAAPNRLEDRWLLSRLEQTVATVRQSLDSYKLHITCDTAYHFLWGDYCDWYLEIAKRRTRAGTPDDLRRVAITLGLVFTDLLKIFHPIMPFITEEIWGHLKPVLDQAGITTEQNAILALSEFPKSAGQINQQTADQQAADKQAVAQFELLQQIVKSVRAMRLAANIAPKLELQCVVKTDNSQVSKSVNDCQELIISLANLKSLTIQAAAPVGFAAQALDQLTVFVNLAEHMDVEAELQRNQKMLEKANKNVAALEAKLANQNFVAGAPAAVVAAERQKLADAKGRSQEIEKIINELKK